MIDFKFSKYNTFKEEFSENLKRIQIDQASKFTQDKLKGSSIDFYQESGLKILFEIVQNEIKDFDFEAVFFEFITVVSTLETGMLSDFCLLKTNSDIYIDVFNKKFYAIVKKLHRDGNTILYHPSFFIQPEDETMLLSLCNESEPQYSKIPQDDLLNLVSLNDKTGIFLQNASFKISYNEFKDNANNYYTGEKSIQDVCRAMHSLMHNEYSPNRKSLLCAIPIVGAPFSDNKSNKLNGLGCCFIYFIFEPKTSIDFENSKYKFENLGELISSKVKELSYNYLLDSGILLAKRARQNALKSAISAIMARNMSHNIGSHVITNTKTELERLALNSQTLQKDLSGLSKLLHYIQERQDFIAVLASGETYTKGPVNLKEHIFDYLAYDGPSIRHRSREMFNNYILDNIVSSEKITRYGSGKKIEICISLKEAEDTITLKSLVSQSTVSQKLDSIYLSIPYGLNGRQAFLTIIENFTRNSAKHLQKDIPQNGLEITITVNKKQDHEGKYSYNIVIQDNKKNFNNVIDNINKSGIKTILSKYLGDENKYKIESKSLKILDESESKPDHNHKGLKEILICLSWMKGNDNYSIIEDNPSEELDFYIINNEGNFAISFSLDCFEEKVFLIEREKDTEVVPGCYYYEKSDLTETGIASFVSKLPSAEIYILDKDEGQKKYKLLQPWLPRLVVSEEFEDIKHKLGRHLTFKKDINNPHNQCKDLFYGIDSDKIESAYYFNKSFILNCTQLNNNNYKSCFDITLLAIDQTKKNLKESSINEEKILSNFVYYLGNEEVESLDSLYKSEYVLFMNHYETIDPKNDFIRTLPHYCSFLEGISGGNYTNSLLRNSIMSLKQYIKIIESCLTRIVIIDERLFEKYKNPEFSSKASSSAFDYISLADFSNYLLNEGQGDFSYQDLIRKFISYANLSGIAIERINIGDSEKENIIFNDKLDYFGQKEEKFKNWMKASFNVTEEVKIIKSWGSYFHGKNIDIYDVDIEEFDQKNPLFISAIDQKKHTLTEIKNSHFISIHYGIIEKINEKLKSNEDLIITLQNIFNEYPGKISVHSGRGDLHKFKDTKEQNEIAFIPLSGIEWALGNSKYMLTELFYNQKYIPFHKQKISNI
ncbi:MAG TPA: hypothetical protein VK250_12460 [Nitrososphaeraceae archaeon]|jgi:hypothetical protein|nr:hypothetical protein [Nitrososphaeraceae archaeon]